MPDECPVFSFQRRTRKLNWRDLLHIDLNRLIQTVDLAALHEQLEPITFADIGEDGQTARLAGCCVLEALTLH